MSTGSTPEATKRKRLSAAARREVIAAAATEVFAERGYHGASIEEIARRSGVTPPVVYDHFASKQDLYRSLLETHFADLREVWRINFPGPDPAGERVERSFDAWFAYVEEHPFAGRMLFRDTTGDPEIAAMHAEVAAESRAGVMPLAAAELGVLNLADSATVDTLSMFWEVLRGVLQGLAMWWSERPDIPREQVVAVAMNTLWIGLERVQQGEAWSPGVRPET
ncbi:MAG TPA: TetR/AcrR family transcriptional regulator [Solirubrobacterales bacterium]|nr:TetR/AcrR family transcriptional regulator [Solirubrobacterales bacterium]